MASGSSFSSGFVASNVEVNYRMEYFVSQFKTEFQEKLAQYRLEADGKGEKVGKTAKFLTTMAGGTDNVTPTGPIKGGINFVGKHSHKTKAQWVLSAMQFYEEEDLAKIFIHSAVEIFYVFERQFMQVKHYGGWKVAVDLISIDLIQRVMNYIHEHRKNDPDCEFKLCDVVLSQCAVYGDSKFDWEKIERFVKRRQNDWALRGMLDKVGIYEEKSGLCFGGSGTEVEKYGCRRLFSWENGVPQKYSVEVSSPYNYVLKLEDLPKLKKEAEVVPEEKQVLTELKEMNKCINSLKSSFKKTIKFDVTYPTSYFTGRDELLNKLHSALLQSTSGKVLVTQKIDDDIDLYGFLWNKVGKSELVRKYISQYGEFFENNCIWLNATNYDSLEESVLRLIEEYFLTKIPTVNIDGMLKDLDRMIEEICICLENISQKTLLVFDDLKNSECDEIDYDVILDKCKLPSVYTIVTSRLSSWSNSASSAASSPYLLEVGVWTSYEAEKYIRSILEPKLGCQKCSEYKNLAERWGFHPNFISKVVKEIKLNRVSLNTAAWGSSSGPIQTCSATAKSQSLFVNCYSQVYRIISRKNAKFQEMYKNHLILTTLLGFLSPNIYIDEDFFLLCDMRHYDISQVLKLPGITCHERMIHVSPEAQENMRVMGTNLEDVLRTLLIALKEAIYITLGKSKGHLQLSLPDYLSHFLHAWGFTSQHVNLLQELKQVPLDILMAVKTCRRVEGYFFGHRICRKLTSAFGRDDEITKRALQCYLEI